MRSSWAIVVPVIRGIKNASSRAGSRARTKTAACGAANRGFESHPARFSRARLAYVRRCFKRAERINIGPSALMRHFQF
jgi:hypothetical protein